MTQHNATFCGCAPKRGYTEIFVQCTYSPSFIILFTRSKVIVLRNKHTNKHTLTNKQTPLKTSNALRYATTLGN